jgi:asparagine synthase (glutamine-hydrolysing)
MFRDLCQLPPGHTLVFEDGALDVRCYWDAEPVAEDIRDAEAWAEIVEPVLRSAVVMRTLSDVPLGAFLSGGIDSSIIVALLAEHASGPIDTFCVGYGEEGRSYDEREGARQVADHFGTRHHELALDSSLLHDIEAVVTGFDEPFGSPTALLSRALSAFTRQHVTVALAGDGGDELFGGYPRYRGMLLSDRASWLPRTAFEWSRRAVEGPESAVARSYRRWARQFLARAQDLPDDRYATWVGYADPSERDRLLGARARDRLRQSGRSRPVQTLYNAPRQADNVQRATYADLHGFLPENVLRCSDRMSMANALELRVPFCDHRLVEIAMQLPTPMRVTELATKRLLRRVARHRIALPPQVLRRRKLGFNAPLGVWLQRDMDRLTNDWLAPDSIAARGLLEPTEVARLIAEHHSGHRDHSVRLWALIVLEQWCRQYSPAL